MSNDLTPLELAEVFNDAGRDFVKSGDRLGYVHRLKALGISNSEILANLVELDIERAELFNAALAMAASQRTKRSGRAA